MAAPRPPQHWAAEETTSLSTKTRCPSLSRGCVRGRSWPGPGHPLTSPASAGPMAGCPHTEAQTGSKHSSSTTPYYFTSLSFSIPPALSPCLYFIHLERRVLGTSRHSGNPDRQPTGLQSHQKVKPAILNTADQAERYPKIYSTTGK